jgi:GAF domain-containing protein
MSPEIDVRTDGGARHERDMLLESIGELFELLLVDESVEETVQRIAELACRTITGCAHASVTRSGEHGEYTAVATDALACEIDQAQYADDCGPCLDALRQQRRIRVPSMSASGDYEGFRAAAKAHGVHSSFSLPLAVGERPAGALNLYSDGESGFLGTDDETAQYFATQVAFAITCAELRGQTRAVIVQLEEALSSRDLIGQAKGVLMASLRVTADDAFLLLRRASQNSNTKLHEISEHVVSTGALPAV